MARHDMTMIMIMTRTPHHTTQDRTMTMTMTMTMITMTKTRQDIGNAHGKIRRYKTRQKVRQENETRQDMT